MGRVKSGLRFLVRALADFLFPPICYGCDEETESGLVCDACRLLLFTSELDVCPVCGRPCLSASDLCGRCSVPLPLARVRALGAYGQPFLGLVHALKYDQKTSLAPLLGRALAALASQDSELAICDSVCAVPLHPARKRERGYNQAQLLAEVVAGETGLQLGDWLVRRKNTPTQTARHDDEARRRNLEGAFALRSSADLRGRRILLVDDVMTSGATLGAAAGSLLAGGAGAVCGLVIAAASVPVRPASRGRR
uniref:ComF family protein n=1 Tax=candidate division WOR-3 bacterium TaxID=2052148 RepID=A0A7C4CCA9_UNCW3